MYKYIFLILITVSLVGSPMLTWAQNESLLQLPDNNSEMGVSDSMAPTSYSISEETAACLDYYDFESVKINVSTAINKTVNGVPMTFTGTIENKNPYPIVNGGVYMKVTRLSGEGDSSSNGISLVDQRFVIENISLQENQSLPINFTWDIPAGLSTGNYQATFQFINIKRSNPTELPMNEHNTVSFSVTGEVLGKVAFNNDSVSINGSKYYFGESSPVVDKSIPVTITADIFNDTDTDQLVPVYFKMYRWDQLREENMIAEESSVVVVPAKGLYKVSHTVNSTTSPVYLVVAETKYNDVKSILNIPFIRSGISSARIIFPSVTKYPLVANEEAAVFSCFYGVGNSDTVGKGKLQITLKDVDNQIINDYSYEGDITNSMTLVKNSFLPKTNLDYFTLSATLYNNSLIVDQVNIVYDCNDSGECTSNKEPTIIGNDHINPSTNKSNLYLLIPLLLFVIASLLFMITTKNKTNNKQIPKDKIKPELPISALFIALFLGSSVFLVGSDASAMVQNQAPDSPVITPTTVDHMVNSSQNFTLQAYDSDNDQIFYALDFDMDNESDVLIPAIGLVNSGTVLPFVKSWGTPGIKQFQATTYDQNENWTEEWTLHEIEICAAGDTWTGSSCSTPPPPYCNDKVATIYVSGGFIVGGINDGNVYSGTISGGTGNQVIVGTAGADTISVASGNATICSLDGDDFILTGSGADYIDAGSGNNVVNSGAGIDEVWSGDGIDIISTGSGDDVVSSGSGNDRITDDSGADNVFAGSGDDIVCFGSGGDVIYGEEGDDVIEVGSGVDIVFGGLGDDQIFFGTGSKTFDTFTGPGTNSHSSGPAPACSGAGTPPSVTIVSPLPATAITIGDLVLVAGDVTLGSNPVISHAWYNNSACKNVPISNLEDPGLVDLTSFSPSGELSYRVRDDQGVWSVCKSVFVTINESSAPPSVTIVSPLPEAVITIGDMVPLLGDVTLGSNPVISHAWYDNLMCFEIPLNTVQAPRSTNLASVIFSTEDPNLVDIASISPSGELSYRVQDSVGDWSACKSVKVNLVLPVVTATLNVTPSCIIADNASTCNVSVDWTSSGVTSPSVSQNGSSFSTDPSNVGTSRTLNRGNSTFAFFDGVVQVGPTRNASAECNLLTATWDGSRCAPNVVPSGTISANVCSIPLGGSNCQGDITWEILNATSPNVYNEDTNTTYSSNSSGNNLPISLGYGINSIQVRDGASVITSNNLNIFCSAPNVWGAGTGSCVPPPPGLSLSLDRHTIRSGATVVASIEVSAPYPVRCTLYGVSGIPPTTFVHSGLPETEVYEVETRPITSGQIISVRCESEPVIPGVGTSVIESRVNVVPIMQEI